MTTSSGNLHPLLSPLEALQNLLNRFPNHGVIIGGIAASILGKPRLTADLDALMMLPLQDIPELIRAAKQEGITPRIQGAEDFARKNRMLLMRHDSSGTNIDISLGALPFEQETVDRSQDVQVANNLLLRLPTPEDLVILKAVAHRPKDMLDIQGIIDSFPDFDRERIKFWVRQFAEALEMPELWDDLVLLLEKKNQRR